MSAIIEGQCPASFRALERVFAKSITEEIEIGASVALYVDGKQVAYLWGGHQDRQRQMPWQEDTLACIFSAGKAVVAVLVAKAVADGLLDYDEAVSTYWPEFSQNGKQTITVAQLLSHQGGLCGFPEEFDPARWLDWTATTEALAAMSPLWLPGSANGYHPQTFGFLAGELLRRVRGHSVGALLRGAFHDLHGGDVLCGVREEEMARAATMKKPPAPPDLGALNEYTKVAFLTRWASPTSVKREDWMAAEIPASNMHATARGLAGMLAPIANRGRDAQSHALIDERTLEEFMAERCHREDLVLPYTLSWAAGIMRNNNGVYGPLQTSIGHTGFGGAMVFADLVNRLSFAYVPNRMSPALLGDDRSQHLIDAVYESL